RQPNEEQQQQGAESQTQEEQGRSQAQNQPDSQNREGGRNTRAGEVGTDPTGAEAPRKIQAGWGQLPDYILQHGRGSVPEVPEKYRRYLEALIKEGSKSPEHR